MHNFCLAEILSTMMAVPTINDVTTMATWGSMADEGFPLLAHGLVEGILHRSDGVDRLHSHDAKGR
jgi:hypothetical protein